MIDINNKIFRNTYGQGFPTLIEVAISNALYSRFHDNVSVRTQCSDIREPVQDIMNWGIKMRVEREINAYEY